MLTTGTWWHTHSATWFALFRKNNSLSKAPAASVSPPQQQIWYMGSKQSCVNSAWINHSLLSHFMSCCILSSSSLLSISTGVWEEEDAVNWARCSPTFYPLSWKWDEQPSSGGGWALSICKMIISTVKHISSVYIVISATNLYLAHKKNKI